MKRFILLNFEPFLTILTDEDLLDIFRNPHVEVNRKRIEEILKKKLQRDYESENIDYIRYMVDVNLEQVFKDKKYITANDYVSLYRESLIKIINNLFRGLEIKNYEQYKFVTQYIEPYILFISFLRLKNLVYNNISKPSSFFIKEDYKNKIELHVHAETSYIFPDLINYIVKNWGILGKDIVRKFIKNINNERKQRYLKLLNYLIFVIKTYLYYLDKEILNRSFVLYNLSLNKDLYLKPLFDFRFLLEKFNYPSFVEKLTINLLENNDIYENLLAISTLIKLNKLNQDCLFREDFKGLKHMLETGFGAFLKKVYQKYRTKLFFKLKKQDTVISETLKEFLHEDNYIELRLSPDLEAVNHWISQIELLTEDKLYKDNIKLIIHFQKFESSKIFKNAKAYEQNLRKKIWKISKKEGLEPLLKESLKNEKLAKYIVALDAAAVEYWTPPWIYRLFFTFIRNFFKLNFNKDINIVFHAGEDFIDVATGLRYIYEAIYFLNAARIGHGLALGVKLDRYSLRYQIISLDKYMYIFHLLWLNHMVIKFANYFKGYISKINEEIYRLFGDIVIEDKNKGDLFYFLNELYEYLGFSWDLYRKSLALKDKDKIYKILHFSFEEEFGDIKKAMYYYQVLFKIISKIKDRIFQLRPVLDSPRVSFEEQLEILKILQEIVLKVMESNNTALEVCPSSNILLYKITTYKDHPILNNLNKFQKIPLLINTDNPLLLNSTIELEYKLTEEIVGKDKVQQFIKNSLMWRRKN